jgi:hypothetical protein
MHDLRQHHCPIITPTHPAESWGCDVSRSLWPELRPDATIGGPR